MWGNQSFELQIKSMESRVSSLENSTATFAKHVHECETRNVAHARWEGIMEEKMHAALQGIGGIKKFLTATIMTSLGGTITAMALLIMKIIEGAPK